jgi:hypothetical protein
MYMLVKRERETGAIFKAVRLSAVSGHRLHIRLDKNTTLHVTDLERKEESGSTVEIRT